MTTPQIPAIEYPTEGWYIMPEPKEYRGFRVRVEGPMRDGLYMDLRNAELEGGHGNREGRLIIRVDSGYTDVEYDPAALARLEFAPVAQTWAGLVCHMKGFLTSWLVRTLDEAKTDAEANSGFVAYLPKRGFKNDFGLAPVALPVEISIYPEFKWKESS